MSGGEDAAAAYAFDLHVFSPATLAWTALASMPTDCSKHSLVAISGGTHLLLLCTSRGAGLMTGLPIYVIASNSWATVSASGASIDYPSNFLAFAAALLPPATSTSQHFVFVHGGTSGSAPVQTSWRLRLTPSGPISTWTANWKRMSSAGAVPAGRSGHALQLIGSHSANQYTFIMFGGRSSSGALSDAAFAIFDTSANSTFWTAAVYSSPVPPPASEYFLTGELNVPNTLSLVVLRTPATQVRISPDFLVTSLSPAVLPAVGGASLTLVGANMLSANMAAAVTSVLLTASSGGASYVCAVSSVTLSSIACTSPALPSTWATGGNYSVDVITSGSLRPFSWLTVTAVPLPTLERVLSSTGAPGVAANTAGTPLTITGTGFLVSGPSDLAGITIGGVACASPAYLSSLNVTCQCPSLPAGRHRVNVTSASGGTSVAAAIVVFAIPAPTIDALSQSTGRQSGGEVLTITGTWLGCSGALCSLASLPGAQAGDTIDNGVTSVLVGTTPCAVTASSPTSLSCTTGVFSGPGMFSITVSTRHGGTTTSLGGPFFTVNQAPAITLVAPTVGAAGAIITISGTGMGTNAQDITTLAIGGVACALVSVTGSPITTLSCTLGQPVALGTFAIQLVTASAGEATSTVEFTYIEEEVGGLAVSPKKRSTSFRDTTWFWVAIGAAALCCCCLLLLLLLLALRRKKHAEQLYVDPMLSMQKPQPPPGSSSYEYLSESPEPEIVHKEIRKRQIRRRSVGFDGMTDDRDGTTTATSEIDEFLSSSLEPVVLH